MPYSHGVLVSTVDFKQRLRSSQGLVKPADFTVLSNSIPKDGDSEFKTIQACSEAYPKEFVRNLVCFNPERLIEQEILAELQATIKLDKSVDDEADTFGRAFTLVQTSLISNGDNEKLKSLSMALYIKAEVDINGFFEELIAGRSLEAFPFKGSDSSRLQGFYKEIAANEPYKSDPALLKLACVQRGLATIYTQEARKIISDDVSKHIKGLCTRGELAELIYVDKKDGVAIFTTGGVASGKGTCLKHLGEVLSHRKPSPVQWDELVHHNADRLKPFLLNPTLDKMRYSQFTYEEALFIKERVMKIIEEKGSELHKYPHFLHDQTKLKASEIAEASKRSGQVLIIAISTEASSSLEWAYGRGDKSGRYEHTEGLLGSHQAVPGEFIKSLTGDGIMDDSDIQVTMYDNNGKPGELEIFATIDLKTKKIVVFNEEKMQKWIKKENINPKAKPEEELYLDKPIRSTEDYFGPLLSLGYSIEKKEGPDLDGSSHLVMTM